MDEVLRLRAIEDEAGTLFEGLGLIEEALDPSFPLDALAKLVDLRQVWVGCLDDDLPVGNGDRLRSAASCRPEPPCGTQGCRRCGFTFESRAP